jgi:hypothetical protein
LHRKLFVLVLEKRQVLSNIYQRPVLVDCYGQYRHKYIDISEAARAKARGITPKLAQPGVWGSLFKTATPMTALSLTALKFSFWKILDRPLVPRGF